MWTPSSKKAGLLGYQGSGFMGYACMLLMFYVHSTMYNTTSTFKRESVWLQVLVLFNWAVHPIVYVMFLGRK
tara:strand:+ start:791 stop:1006 length:216 start_codon:yes stop_codon:yes gene_type:complete